MERKLLVISEAAIRLGDEAETLCPGLPWRDIRGIGNWLRHQYDAIDPQAVWRTVMDDLPALQAAVRQTLAKRSSNKPQKTKQITLANSPNRGTGASTIEGDQVE